jgi:poly(A) polymerase/tRNA nucleotidyltransferase (CCA-adding enzyme)
VTGDQPALRIDPPAWLHDPALAAVLAAVPRARLVGGAVRDALLGRPVADVDLATPDPPDAVTRALREAGLKAVPTGLEHGTITAVSGGRGFEVTTLRRDVATDGRRAVVAFTGDWCEDAARRDFSINAMSMSTDGAVYDYFDGVADLRDGRVRFVGDAAQRIAEDFLRILRFFRFHARYGRGEPDGDALTAIAAAVPGLNRLSAERVWSELRRILAAPDPREAIALMQRLGVLDRVLPEGTNIDPLARLVARGAPPDPILRLAALLAGGTEALAERLRFSIAERERLFALRVPLTPPADADDATLRRFLADTPKDILIDRLWLTGGDASLRARLANMAVPVFPLHGRDLRTAGLPTGPQLGALLRDLRGWWLEGGCVADAAACRAELKRRLAAQR